MSLVLLTPIALDEGCWAYLELPDVETHKHVFPGFGQRPLPAGLPSMGDLADEVAALYPGPLDVAGVSMGGMVAQHLAIRHPERVRSVLTACTGAAVDPAMMEQRAVDTETEGIEGVLDVTLRRWFTAGALAQPDHPGVAYARRTLLALEAATFAAAWRTMAGHNVRDRLGEIRAPTTCLMGRSDPVGTRERVGEIAERVQRGRFVECEGPHMLPLEQPDEFATALRDHLAWVGT